MSIGKYGIIGLSVAVAGVLVWWVAVGIRSKSTGDDVKKSGEPHPTNKEQIRLPLTEEEKKILGTWLGHEPSMQKAQEVAAICLKHKLTFEEIVNLVGAPNKSDATTMWYFYAPSHMLVLQFDKGGHVISTMPRVQPSLDKPPDN